MNHKPKVLFFSKGDSTRSQIAEGFLRTFAGKELPAVSTATQSLEADPLAREVMKEAGIDISGQQAKQVAESLQGALLLHRNRVRFLKGEVSRVTVYP